MFGTLELVFNYFKLRRGQLSLSPQRRFYIILSYRIGENKFTIGFQVGKNCNMTNCKLHENAAI